MTLKPFEGERERFPNFDGFGKRGDDLSSFPISSPLSMSFDIIAG